MLGEQLCIYVIVISMTFDTQLLCPTNTCFNTGPQPDLFCGDSGSHLQNGRHVNIQCPISRLILYHIDIKFILVNISMFSRSTNPNMAIMLCQPLFFFNMAATFYGIELHYLQREIMTHVCFPLCSCVFLS